MCACLWCLFHCGSPAFIWNVFCITAIAASLSICGTQVGGTKAEKGRGVSERMEAREKGRGTIDKMCKRKKKTWAGIRGGGWISAIKTADCLRLPKSQLAVCYCAFLRWVVIFLTVLRGDGHTPWIIREHLSVCAAAGMPGWPHVTRIPFWKSPNKSPGCLGSAAASKWPC